MAYDPGFLLTVDAQDEQLATYGMVRPVHAPPTDINFAEDRKTLNIIRSELVPLLENMRDQRRGLEEEWRSIMRMNNLVHDPGSRRYFGRHDIYLPLYAQIKRTKVAALSRALFPSDQYLAVTDRRSGNPESAKPVEALIQWEFDNARLRLKMKSGLAQLIDFGFTPLQSWYKKSLRYEARTRAQGTLARFAAVQHGLYQSEGFATAAPSAFSFYVWPTTATCTEEATVIAHDVVMARKDIQGLIERGYFLNAQHALSAPEPSSHQVHMSESATVRGITSPTDAQSSPSSLGEMRVLTKVNTFLRLPQAAYAPGEDPSCPVPVVVVMAGPWPLSVKRNPLFSQRPEYEFLSLNADPGQTYGFGDGKLAYALNVLGNDFFNQTADVGSYILNPIVKRVPNLMAGPTGPMYPGKIYDMLELTAMEFDRPPHEMADSGTQLVNLIAGMTNDFTGAPAQYQGIAAGKGASTATQAQILQRNLQNPMQDMVQDIEEALLVPGMRACWRYNQQFRNQAVIAAVAGVPVRIEPWQLDIEADMRWLASSQAVNQAQRAQNAMMLLQAIGPMIPYLNQTGYFVDVAPVLDRIYSDGFGFRDFSRFVRKVGGPGANPALVQMQQQAMMAAGDRARSTVEQAEGGERGMDAAPGEAEDFMQVRGEADDLAAMMGGMNGRMMQ
jgi:hypothetical protein